MRGSRFFFILFITALCFSSAARGAEDLRIEKIRYGGGSKVRIVFDLNQKADFRAFLLADPARIVVDLPHAEWKTYKSQMVHGNAVIRAYRSGDLDDGLTRVIFDIKKPAIIENIFTLPKSSMNKDRLVLDLVPASINTFTAQTERIFGNTGLKGTPAAKAQRTPVQVSDYAVAQKKTARISSPGASPKPAPSSVKKQDRKYVIVIDPGHGGGDPGGVSHGVKEKNVTLAVALELRRQLEETGRYKVVLTRDRDFYIKLYQRVDISRQVKGDLFISIHADKIDRKGVRGASIYTLSETASDAETERLAEEENNAGFVAGVDLSQETQDVADILLDLAMREKMNESNLFASILEGALRKKTIRLLPNSHRSAGFAVLKAPDVPSVLVEIGFISNQDEAKLMSSGRFQSNIAAAILEGTDAYFRKIQAVQAR